MRDLLDELAAAQRVMGASTLPAGEAYTVEIARRYDADVEDVWEAITDPERLARWLKPITGDLRRGGTYELEGGEHGEILHCEPPRALRVTWMFGPEADAWPGTSEVEVRLTPAQSAGTDVRLVHAASVGEPMFPTYGPGAGGVGWDLMLLSLARHLADGTGVDHEALESSSDGHELVRRSAAAWGRAHLAAGGDPEQVATAVAATTAFYTSGPS